MTVRRTSAVLAWALTFCAMSLLGDRAYAQPSEGEEPRVHKFLEPKPGKSLTFYTPGGEITVYGNLDVSLDDTTKGISGLRDSAGNRPTGRVDYLPAMSTNLSYVGARGFERLGGTFRFVYQLETQVDIAATSGTPNTNSNSGAVVRGGLTSRNTYIGLSSPWGALKGGKTDAPYKLSTARMNPFSGMIGDYQVVMANTGGDNRVEFGTRLDHSIWYESPNLGGLTFAALISPGQNRSDNSDNIPAGEADCAGGNIPGSGGLGGSPPGTFPISCNDGSFNDAYSVSAAFEKGPIYVTGAYERHRKVNRNSDIYGIYGVFPLPAPIANYDLLDIADEGAAKVGVQVALPTKTTVSGIYEDMRRFVPSQIAFQNERQRTGFWFAVSQQLGPEDSVHVGWAHANRAQGDPGQHNTAVTDVGNGGAAGGADADNVANMITAALKHQLADDVLVYATWAMTINHPFAHYDFGAGGRAVTTDCHDGGLPAGGDLFSNPHCWAGGRLIGFSVGLNKRF
jgi:predicted porin